MKYELSKERATRLVKLVLPLYLEMFHHLKAQRGGDLVWPPSMVEQKKNLKANNYVDLYDDDKRLTGAMNLAIFDSQKLEELKTEINEKGHEEVYADLDDLFDNFLIDTQDYLTKLRADPNYGDEDTDSKYTPEQIKQIQYFCISSLAIYHNVFSIMVYGKSLSKLVQEAIGGNDKSFLQAVKIDHNLIYDHPYFKERLAKANQDQEVVFLQRVHEQQLAPSLSGRIKHKGLYTMFYFLDMVKVLDKFPNNELLDLYQVSIESDLDEPPYDLSSFMEILKRYRKSR